MRNMQGGVGGKGGPMTFGRSKAKLLDGGHVKTNFTDVAGCEEAKEDVKELVDFLKDPAKFIKVGGKIPRGILMVGPPGTGKTLLARAVAGEAGVSFLSASGSEFIEMYVGLGAQRLLPAMQQSYCAWASIKSNKTALQRVINSLENPYRTKNYSLLNKEANLFNHSISESSIDSIIDSIDDVEMVSKMWWYSYHSYWWRNNKGWRPFIQI